MRDVDVRNEPKEDSGMTIRHLYSTRPARERQLCAPLLSEREAYLRHLTGFGRGRRVVADSGAMIIHVVRLTKFDGSGRVTDGQIVEAANGWVYEMQSNTRFPLGASGRSFKSIARGFFRFLGVYGAGQPKPWFEKYISQYVTDSSREHSRFTVRSHMYAIRGFLSWVSIRHHELSSIGIGDVDDYITEKIKMGWRPRTSVNLCRSLRSFFRYTESRGWTDGALSRAVKAPWFRAIRDVPNCPTWKQVRRRIAILDTKKPSHCRAKAILLLAAVYGLRTCEIARLTLDDFDWYNEVMTIRRAKNGRLQQFPIQFEVGEAIIRYLLQVRPACPSRNVFITLQTPYRAAENLGTAIRDLINASTVFVRPCGLHALRHACATELLKQGTSLRGIADFLGHRDLRSVGIYAHCDVRMLRKVGDMSLKGVL